MHQEEISPSNESFLGLQTLYVYVADLIIKNFFYRDTAKKKNTEYMIKKSNIVLVVFEWKSAFKFQSF